MRVGLLILVCVFVLAAVIVISSIFLIPCDTNEEVFNNNCAKCHARDGRGNPKMAALADGNLSRMDLTRNVVVEKSDAEIVGIILEGWGKMPAYKKKLSNREISKAIEHLRILQKRKSKE